MLGRMLLPTRSAMERMPACSCTSIFPGGTLRSPHTSPSDLTFSFCFTTPAFDKVGVGPCHLRWLLLLLDRRLPPREKELASSWARQLCEIATEVLVHPPSKPRVERDLRCSKLSDQLAQRQLGLFGFQENDRCPSTGRLRCKPHGLCKDAQTSPRFRVLLKARTRKLLQETPPGLFLIRRDLPHNQRSPTNSTSTVARQFHSPSPGVYVLSCVCCSEALCLCLSFSYRKKPAAFIEACFCLCEFFRAQV